MILGVCVCRVQL